MRNRHYTDTLTEAAHTNSPQQIRNLLAIILTTCAPSDPKRLWKNHKESLTEDILWQAQQKNPTLNRVFTTELFNQSLILLEDKCIEINNKLLHQLGLPSPNRNVPSLNNREMMNENQYDIKKTSNICS